MYSSFAELNCACTVGAEAFAYIYWSYDLLELQTQKITCHYSKSTYARRLSINARVIKFFVK